MAGKFINTTTSYSQIVNQASQIMKGRLDNPYYIFSDKKASESVYYNINTTMTTLDESTRGNYSEISSKDSPLRYNKIKGFLVYGISRIEPNLELNEFGLEGDVNGELLILPRTIIPYPDDYFYLTSIGEKYIFKITSVNPNTLETGATMYRCTYILQSSDGVKSLEPQVVKTFVFNLNTGGIESDNGTNLTTSIIDEDSYNKASLLQEYTTTLKDYFISLFYDAKVQTFTYYTNPHSDSWFANNGIPKPLHIGNMQDATNKPFGIKVYDSYLIEFLIRNRILDGSSAYIHVDHQMFLQPTFALDYDRTIFSSIENQDIDKHYGYNTGNLLLCDQRLSLLYAYPENYYFMSYNNLNAKLYYINIFDDPRFVSNNIKEIKYTNNILKDIIIKYFNNYDITNDDLLQLKHIDYMSNREFFYCIPFVIFILEKEINKTLVNSNTITN